MTKTNNFIRCDLVKTTLTLHPYAAEAYAIWASAPSLIPPDRMRTEALIAALEVTTLVATSDPEGRDAYVVFGGFQALKLCSMLKARGAKATVTVEVHRTVTEGEVNDRVAKEVVALVVFASQDPRQTDWVRAAVRAAGKHASRTLTGKPKWTDARLDRLIARQSRTRVSDPFAFYGPKKSPTLFAAILQQMDSLEHDQSRGFQHMINPLAEEDE